MSDTDVAGARFPEAKEVKQRIRDIIDPDRGNILRIRYAMFGPDVGMPLPGLGHSDVKVVDAEFESEG
eukprot:3614417-Rhodomonas_salina.2